MIADHAMARAIAQSDVEEERLEQIVALERGEEGGTCSKAFVEVAEHLADAFEIGRRIAGRVEHERAFVGLGDPRMIEIDVDLGRAVRTRGAADQEWLD